MSIGYLNIPMGKLLRVLNIGYLPVFEPNFSGIGYEYVPNWGHLGLKRPLNRPFTNTRNVGYFARVLGMSDLSKGKFVRV